MGRRVLLWICLVLGLSGCRGALTTPPGAATSTARFIVSQDGNLWQLTLPSTTLTPLVEAAPVAAAHHPALSPDGTQLAYAYQLPIPTPSPTQPFIIPRTEIYLTTAAGGIGTPVHGPLEGFDSLDQPAWSMDKTTIYAHYRTMRFAQDGVFLKSGDDIMAITIATKVMTPLIENALYPTPSPDGTRLAFVRPGTDQPPSLMIYDLATKTEQVIMQDATIAALEAPAWSTDSATLYFSMSPVTARPGEGRAPWRWVMADTAQAHGLGWYLWKVDVSRRTAQELNPQVFEDPRLVYQPGRLYIWTLTGLWQLDLQAPATPPVLLRESGDVYGITGLP